MSLSPKILKKTDLVSSALLQAYKTGLTVRGLTGQAYLEKVAKHVIGNLMAGQVPNTMLPDAVKNNLSGEEIATAAVFAADSSLRKRKKLATAGMDAVEVVIAERIAKMIVEQFFQNNEVF